MAGFKQLKQGISCRVPLRTYPSFLLLKLQFINLNFEGGLNQQPPPTYYSGVKEALIFDPLSLNLHPVCLSLDPLCIVYYLLHVLSFQKKKKNI